MLPQAIFSHLLRPVSSTPFLLMRRVWAVLTIGTLLLQIQDVSWFYSSESFLPLKPDVFGFTEFPSLSLFHVISNPQAVLFFYGVTLLLLLCIALDRFPRAVMPIAFVLLLSFHQRNPLVMGGGDVLLHNIGFLLAIATLFYEPQMRQGTMPVWLRYLLLWQVVVIYLASAWSKLLGDSWIDGSAVSSALQHPHFSRFLLPLPVAIVFSPLIGYITIAWEFLWAALLVPQWKYAKEIKRFLLGTGVLFHVAIMLFLRVGPFSLAMLCAYIGILDRWPKRWWSSAARWR